MKKLLPASLAAALFLGSLFASAQNRGGITVKGRVVDDDGQPIPGAAIVVDGTTNGTVTDFDGNYTIIVPSAESAIKVTFIGMKEDRQVIGDRTTINVSLAADNEELDEVVVTALGITRDKKALGYAIAEVDGDEMLKSRGGMNNPVNALQGKVAGLSISSGSGSMGGSSKMLIRGNNSISGNNQPLFVIDGVPIEGTDFNTSDAARGAGGYDYGNLVSDINPDDIESMTVLKGASATALYGSRASNGVVLITTKKGRVQPGYGVTLSSTVGFEKVNKLPKLQRLYGGGYGSDFESVTINGKDYLYPDMATDESWGPKYEGQKVLTWYDLAKWEANGKQGDPTVSEWKAPEHDIDDFFETGVSTTNTVSVENATSRVSSRISFTNTVLTGYMPNSKMTKNVVNASIKGSSPNHYLTTEANITFLNQKAKGRAETGYGDNNVMQKFVQWGHRELDMDQLKEIYEFPDGTQATWNRSAWDDPTPAYSNNPYWSRYKNYETDSRNRVYGNIGATWERKWLKLQYKVSLDFFADKQEERNAVGSQEQSAYSETRRQQYELNHEFLASFNKQFGEDWHLNVNLGGNIMHSNYSVLKGSSVGGIAIADFYNLKNSISTAAASNGTTKKSINSLFGSFSIGWKNMLFLDGTVRNDKSSTLPTSNNSYTYPSLTASWIFSDLLAKPWLTYGKLRAGIAKVGNDTDPYSLISTYSQYTNIDSSTPGYRLPSTLNNPDLKPESTKSFEVGLEMSFLSDRVGFDFTYYHSTTTDQIIPLSVSGTTGYIYKVVNSGEMENKGIELAVHGTPIKNDLFQWNMGITLASNKNKVVELIDGVDYYRLTSAPFKVEVGAKKGDPYGVIMGTNYVYDENGHKLVDESGLYQATDGNENLGSIFPDFTGGFSNSFKLWRFDASILFDFSKGGHWFSTSNMWGMYSGMLEESVENGIRENGIVVDGYKENGTKNDIVADGQEYCEWFYTGPAAQNVFKSDYIKLREVTLGYNFPFNAKDNFIHSLRLSAYGRNLHTWGPDVKHWDPESAVTSSGNVQGIEGAALPGLANFGFSVTMKF